MAEFNPVLGVAAGYRTETESGARILQSEGMRIYKYDVPVEDTFFVDMPHGARVLSVAVQNHKPVMWALVNTEHKLDRRTFHVYGTGNSLPESIRQCQFIGTFQLVGGTFVGHLFQE